MLIVYVHVQRYDQYSILLLSYSISSGAQGSPDLLLSYSVITLALHNTIILIMTHLYLSTPKSTINQLIQACSESGSLATSFTVEFLQRFGNLPLLVPEGKNLYNLNAVSGATIFTVAKQIVGTKESSACSNRGLCDSGSGFCLCNINYATSNGYAASGTRGDCGYPTATIQACPGSISCSGHGECGNSPTYKCDCSVGWTG